MTIVNIVAIIPKMAIPMAINDGVSVHCIYFMSIWKQPKKKTEKKGKQGNCHENLCLQNNYP